MTLTVKDLEKVQRQLGDDYRVELVDGEIVLMSPSDYESDEVASEFGVQLRNWVKPRQLGRVTGAGAGFNRRQKTGDRRLLAIPVRLSWKESLMATNREHYD